MKFNYHACVGLCYIAFVTGLACASVGDMPTISNEPYGWEIPVTMFCITIVPFIAGYLANKEN